ncbi:MAG: hypothetical protein COA96_10220 [SAR86 cluster bacterium]|uniref:Uncharacterized protein n=1 Tax=SAR86 cluster bacterium TaxID=2030880 RepID=A0A2A5AYD6_9GAMM|nr:MAG: hypothetical protein COA96_10220 [SAR86 cluster bacterium]
MKQGIEDMAESLGDALPAKMKQIREEYIPSYQSVGPAGGFAVMMMQHSLTKAEQALSSGDVVEMLEVFAELNAFKL